MSEENVGYLQEQMKKSSNKVENVYKQMIGKGGETRESVSLEVGNANSFLQGETE